MADYTVTIELEGDVPLSLFAQAIQQWQQLLSELSSEIGRDANIEWIVDDLRAGSAIATVRGESEQTGTLERVVRGYEIVGKALATNQPIPYSDRVATPARALTSVLNGKITAVRFSTPDESATVHSPQLTSHSFVVETAQPIISFGAIEGRIQTLTERRELRFTLFDSLYDHAIPCFLQDDQRDMMRNVWGHRAIVQGRIARDPILGRPKEIRQITDVAILDDVQPGTYQAARGVAPIGEEGLSAEEAIRRVRDAW